jgi:uncharacterized membrane protein
MKKLFWNEIENKLTFEKVLPYILIVGGIIGLVCSIILTYDGFKLAQNPHYQPSCNLNPILSCGDVALSSQGTLFGNLPNSWMGVAAFPVLITTGVAMLAGGRFKKWYWLGLEGGGILGIAFVHWLFFESVYRIHALCPYCMVVWAVTITVFWYITLYNLEKGHIKFSHNEQHVVARFAQKHHLDILVFWLVVIAALILKHFWYYYGHYL